MLLSVRAWPLRPIFGIDELAAKLVAKFFSGLPLGKAEDDPVDGT
jgi:hypothetical protein